MRHANNFDLIRLFGALEVVLVHGLKHLHLAGAVPPIALTLLGLFPGVPIFFVVSGFLITASLERSRSITDYAWKRFLRIYPALWACFGATLALLAGAGALTPGFLRSTFLPWIAAQLSIVQVFNPDALRGFGTGVVNGSLWTIPVEIGFYFLLPVLLVPLTRAKASPRAVTAAMAAAAVPSLALWMWVHEGPSTVQKLAYVTPFAHFWMFLMGALAWRHRERIMPFVQGRFVPWLAAYVAAGLLLAERGNAATALTFVLLVPVVLSAAFTRPEAAERLLRGNDVSYGVYIYHMLVVNLAVHLGWTGSVPALAMVFAGTLTLASLSWRYVEKPALRRKTSVPLLPLLRRRLRPDLSGG